jgi:hypothetical protein
MVVVLTGAALVFLGHAASALPGQDARRPPAVDIPANATLEGIPAVRIDSFEGGTMRRVLGPVQAANEHLTIRVVDGQFFWTSRGDRPLHLNRSDGFTYLSSEPGRYVRFTRLGDSISYVEHVDMGLGSVTWWGELTIAVGKPRE